MFSHAAISRHVRDLEAWLKVPLFRRLSRGVVATEAGRTLPRGALTPIFDRPPGRDPGGSGTLGERRA